ncbi:DUF1646 family protein [Pyrobaculum ferrireducens]|uniref:DUF1646 family protein n=1 Tax=Pyrobaculum ferrireducens TaxID=1104324 RepID=UPI0011E4E553|nr:DUF1646 family protein [Pyrobaculum ferrireducens]
MGEFFKPLTQAAAGLGREALYVFDLMSAVADNATLVAALINGDIAVDALRSFVVSIVISGGFTIPGNAPNIVLANVLKISFREWMKLALPIGIMIFIAAGIYVLWLVPYPLL